MLRRRSRSVVSISFTRPMMNVRYGSHVKVESEGLSVEEVERLTRIATVVASVAVESLNRIDVAKMDEVAGSFREAVEATDGVEEFRAAGHDLTEPS